MRVKKVLKRCELTQPALFLCPSAPFPVETGRTIVIEIHTKSCQNEVIKAKGGECMIYGGNYAPCVPVIPSPQWPTPAQQQAHAWDQLRKEAELARKARELRDILAQIDPQNQAEALMMAGIAMMMP